MPKPLPPLVEPITENVTKLLPPYNVILLNDDDHSVEYVIEMMQKLFNYDPQKGFKIAQEVDKSGRCIVWTGPLEHAEFKRDQIHAYGPDWRIPRCAGSMSADIEPAE